MIQHKHTGRQVPHEHTSYAALGFVVLVVGVVMAAVSPPVKAGPNDINVGANVLTSAPTIIAPNDGQHFAQPAVSVSGGCVQDVVVEVFKNNVFAGSAVCSAAGTYSMQIDLFAGRNSLVARHYRPGPVSPDSNSVAAYYDRPAPPASSGHAAISDQVSAPAQFLIQADEGYMGSVQGAEVSWPITLTGGNTPYAVSIDWGEGESEVVNLPTSGTHTFKHTYQSAGRYKVIVKAQDSDGQSALLQLTAIVQTPVTTASTGQSTKSPEGSLVFLWPLYAALAFILVSFWLGERYEQWFIKRRLNRQGYI